MFRIMLVPSMVEGYLEILLDFEIEVCAEG